MTPPATPPAIAATFGPLSPLSVRTGAVDEVGLGVGVWIMVRTMVVPSCVTVARDVDSCVGS